MKEFSICFSHLLIILSIDNSVNSNDNKLGDEIKISNDADLFTDEDAVKNDKMGLDESLDLEVVRNIGKISVGIRRLVDKRDHGKWYWCGELLDAHRQEEISIAIAYRTIVFQQIMNAENISSWGIIATAYNESGLDACAIGYHPRKWAYKKGFLKKRKNRISHNKQEVLDFINNPIAKKKYRKSGFDLGYCQVLSRFYRGKEYEALSHEGGIKMCVEEMQRRSNINKTNQPWKYWKGTNKAGWYQKRIKRWVQLMGAPLKEIRKI